jgi:hypothetical protein
MSPQPKQQIGARLASNRSKEEREGKKKEKERRRSHEESR